MNLSDNGLNFIVGFEGLLKKLPDGTYRAYRCPANVLTIYAGCTEGVSESMIVTDVEGKAMFRRELAKHEAAVRRLVTVDLNQNQFDSLISCSYNIGIGALGKSTLLKHLNAGDYARAASHFGDFKKAGGKVLAGLVRRRAAEAALFMQDTEPADMVQRVDAPDTKMKPAAIAAKVAVPAVVATKIITDVVPVIPKVPAAITDTVSNVAAWQKAGEGIVSAFPHRGVVVPLLAAALAYAAIVWGVPRIRGR